MSGPSESPARDTGEGMASWVRWIVAAVVGLAGTVFLSFFVHWYESGVFEDWGAGRRQVIVYALSPFVFFMLILFTVLVNAPLRKLIPSVALGRRELMIILVLWLVTGAICHAHLVMPIVHASGSLKNTAYVNTTKKAKLNSYLRDDLFLSEEQSRDYYQGLSEDMSHVSPLRVPLGHWTRPMAFWIPLILVIVIFSVSLVRTVHRQWSQHELLTYPLAEYAESMLAVEEGRAFPAVFYSRAFQVGFVAIFLIFLVNGLHGWFPKMIQIPMGYGHTELTRKFPFLNKYCGREAYALFRSTLYPAVIALAVLLPTEISFSSWLGFAGMILGTGVFYKATGETIGNTETEHIRYGMYVALLCMILYIGRREYVRVLFHAISFAKTDDKGLRGAARSARVFMLAFVALAALLMIAGFDALLSFIVVCCFALTVLLAARMTAEMGMPWLINLRVLTAAIPRTLLGAAALGPKGLALLAVVASLLTADPSNSVAAQETTIGRLREKVGKRVPFLNTLLAVTVCLAVGASVLATLWDNYSFGAQRERRGAGMWSGQVKSATNDVVRLKTQGMVETLDKMGPIERIGTQWRLPDKFGRFFLMGAGIIVLCSLMRFINHLLLYLRPYILGHLENFIRRNWLPLAYACMKLLHYAIRNCGLNALW